MTLVSASVPMGMDVEILSLSYKEARLANCRSGFDLCIESACYETSMALVTFSFGSVFGMVMVKMPSSTLAEIWSFTTSSGST